MGSIPGSLAIKTLYKDVPAFEVFKYPPGIFDFTQQVGQVPVHAFED